MLAATFDNTLRLWDYSSGKCLKSYTGHVNLNYCCPAAFLMADRLAVVTGSEDGRLLIWDLQTKEMVTSIQAHQGFRH